MIRGNPIPFGEFLKRLWADPRFRKVAWYLIERMARRLYEKIEEALTKNKNKKPD